MISRIVSLIAVLLVVVVSSVDAFSTQQHSSVRKTRHSQLQTPTICFAEGDESNIDAANDEPKVAVKCPDCDLCDGSGRCVCISYHLVCISYALNLQFTCSLFFLIMCIRMSSL